MQKLKAVMLIVDGMGDIPYPQLGGRTPFSAVFLPKGIPDGPLSGAKLQIGSACPAGWPAESSSCILSLLGALEGLPFGRAYFEGLAQGIAAGEDQVILRCNLVQEDREGRLCSFQGGGFSPAQMRERILSLRLPPEIALFPLSGYRNLLVLPRDCVGSLYSFPPHEHVGQSLDDLIRRMGLEENAPLLYQAVEESRSQIGDGLCLYPWGPSKGGPLDSFSSRYGYSAGAVCQAEISRGIALALGMETPLIPGATGEADTDLFRKAETACRLLEKHPFVLIHVNGADELSHRRDLEGKVSFLHRVKQELITPLFDQVSGDWRFFLCADHQTSVKTGKHSKEPCEALWWESSPCRAGKETGEWSPHGLISRLL